MISSIETILPITTTLKLVRSHNEISTLIQIFNGPTCGGMVLRSKLVDGGCLAKFPVALVHLSVRGFRVFLQKSRKYGLGSLRKTPTEGKLPIGPDPISKQLAVNLHSTCEDNTAENE